MYINFAEHNFTQQDMALMLGVSRRTVENRMAEFYYYYYTLIDALIKGLFRIYLLEIYTCMQQSLALVSTELYFPSMKYLKVVVIFTHSILLQEM